MGMLKKLFGNNPAPVNSDPMFDIIYNYLDNGSDDFDVNGKNVYAVSDGVFSVCTKIASTIADKPILSGTAYQGSLFNQNVNPNMSSRDWLYSSIFNELLWGNSFSYIDTDNNGMVDGLYLLPTPQITIQRNSDGTLSYIYAPTGETFNSSQILNFKINSIDGKIGISPIVILKRILLLSNESVEALQNYYKNGCMDKVNLQVDDDKLPKRDREKIKKQFAENLGSENAGGSIITDNHVSVKPLNLSSNVNGNVLKETKNGDYYAKRIASAFGVDSSVLGVQNPHQNGSDTYSKFLNQIKPYEQSITSELCFKLKGNYRFKDTVPVLSATDVSNLAKSGAITPDQAQTLLGLK